MNPTTDGYDAGVESQAAMPPLGIGSNFQAGTMNGEVLPRTIDPNADVTAADNAFTNGLIPQIPSLPSLPGWLPYAAGAAGVVLLIILVKEFL
jgi:hypothetical protein